MDLNVLFLGVNKEVNLKVNPNKEVNLKVKKIINIREPLDS